MLVVVGDSHTVALHDGLSSLDHETVERLNGLFGSVKAQVVMAGYSAFQPFFFRNAEGISFIEPIGSRLAELLEDDGVIAPNDQRVFGFCLGFHIFGKHESLFGSAWKWRNHSVVSRRDRSFVSKAVTEKLILQQGRYILEFAEALNEMGVRAFFIGPPAVRRQHVELNHPMLTVDEMLSLQESFWSVMGAALGRVGVPYILAPSEATHAGMLLPEFELDRSWDTFHANAAFGEVVWRHIADRAACGEL